MEYLSHLYLPGAVAIWAALFFALATMWGYAMALTAEAGDTSALTFARRSYGFFALSILLAAMVLSLLLMTRDFRVEYVFQYSGLDLPGYYQFAAFWAGQKGSFMIWLFWGTMLGLLVRRTTGRTEPAVMGIYTLTLLGLLLILVRENPFVMLKQTPLDGQGLNPLLQDNWMVIHPPIMFIGYAATAIPFAFAMASLWRRKYDGWAARAFPWALGGFLVLGTAILMGGYWAYKTLGWGGYWGWDPVENASFIPWLFGTVLIHGLYLERTRNRFRRANYIFTFLTYIAVLYGTFLTRSGVLADFSVHSFVDLGISGWLTFLLGGFMLLGIYLIATRWREIPTAPNEDPFLSRGTFLVLGTITILLAAFVITAGTSAPLLTHFMESQSQVGPSFYNKVNLPIAMLVAFLLAFVPYLTWKGTPPRELLRKVSLPVAFGVAVAVAAAVWRVRDAFHLVVHPARGDGAGDQLPEDGREVPGRRAEGDGRLPDPRRGRRHPARHHRLLRLRPELQGDADAGGQAPGGRHGAHLHAVHPAPGAREGAHGDPGGAGRRQAVHGLPEDVHERPHPPDDGQSGHQELAVPGPLRLADRVRPRAAAAAAHQGAVGKDRRRRGALRPVQPQHGRQRPGGDAAGAAGHHRRRAGDHARGGGPSTRRRSTGSTPAAARSNPRPWPSPAAAPSSSPGSTPAPAPCSSRPPASATPAKISIDVTRKPLIQLVWGGLYVMLIGGVLTMIQRYRQMRVLEAIEGGARQRSIRA